MSATTTSIDEIESARQEYLNELKEDGESIDQFASGSFGCHELLDRTSMFMDSLERFILSHPACVQKKEWFSLAYQAVHNLNVLYQKVGADHM